MEIQAEQVGEIQRATFNDHIFVSTGPFLLILGYVSDLDLVSENICKDERKRPSTYEDTIVQSSN